MARHQITTLTIALLVVLVLSGEAFAEPYIDQIWPPVVTRGRVTRIEVVGKQIEQALGLWMSVPNETGSRTPLTASVAAPGDGIQAAFDVTVPGDAPLGLYGVRIATKSGLSNVHLFLVDELPLTAGERSRPLPIDPLSLPACVAAPVRKAQVDRYLIDVQAGQRVAFEVVGNRLGKDFDPVITLRDTSGKMIARCDNSVGLFFDCRFSHQFSAAGRYAVEITDGRYAAADDWNYVLRMGDFPEARTAVPAGAVREQETPLSFPQGAGLSAVARPPQGTRATWFFQELRLGAGRPATWVPLAVSSLPNRVEQSPNNAPTQATRVEFPGAFSGVLGRPGEEDWFAFEMKKGQTLRVRGETSRIGSAADLELVLYEPTNDPVKEPAGREVQRNDETSTRDNERNTNFAEEANFAFNIRTDGIHRLLVRDFTGGGSPAHTYRVEVSENTPELKIRSDISDLTVPRGNYQPLPLKLTRTGFNGPVELEMLGAPPGVTLSPLTIPADDNEVVCRLSAAESATEGLATLQIVARAKGMVNRPKPDKPNETMPVEVPLETVVTVHPLIDRQTANKDRILTALRADQRELPPSLTDRIALQVTPPSPFDVELAAELVKLPKYQTADLPIVTRRQPGFTSPITFSAKGGQLGNEREERVQVYFRAPAATVETPNVNGTFFNRILTQYQKHRVDVSATALQDGHEVTLTRTFRLDIHPAFEPRFEPAELELHPGEKGTLKVVAGRVLTFDGEIALTAQNPPGQFQQPESIKLAAGKQDAPLEIIVKPGTNPGRYQIRYESTGYVGKFQELVRNPVLTINVKKPPDPKKEEKK